MGSISHHIMPLVINNLRGGHTQTRTQAYRRSRTEAVLRNQAHAGLWLARVLFKNMYSFNGINKLQYTYVATVAIE